MVYGRRIVRHLRTIFFGTDDVSLPTLRALRERLPQVTELAVVTAEPKAKVKGKIVVPPVLAYARERGIATHHFPDKESAWSEWPSRVGAPGSWCAFVMHATSTLLPILYCISAQRLIN